MNTTALATEKMIGYCRGSLGDIAHFIKVLAYAQTIGQLESLPPQTQQSLELAAVVHDIACPLCREKYGNANGKAQEEEGPPLAREFLLEMDLPGDLVERVCFLVGHHHTLNQVDGLDYQILLEADFLVNAHEGQKPRSAIEEMERQVFKTQAGTRLLQAMYLARP